MRYLFTMKAARRPVSVVSGLALFAGIAVATPNSAITKSVNPFVISAAAAANEVLILGATVTGGAASLEGQRIAADGYTPVVVDDATWQSMTTAQFASYQAIVIGDPTCGSYNDTSHLAAALSNPATWGAAVNGNVLIIGTDPVFHSGDTLISGPGQLVAHGIDFALAQAGKVGAYIDLSCAYGTVPPNTPVTLLDGIRPGGFTVDGGPSTVCYNDAHIVASHPALTGLTDEALSNWGCSVHEAFDTWPADYTVLAMARNFGSTFTASDGTIGTPYILASGQGLHSYPLSLSPASQTVAVATSATVTASLLDTRTGNPAPGIAISFRVQAGPNTGTTGTCVPAACLTDSAGSVSWTYIGTSPGADTVQAWLDTNGNGVPDPGEAQTTAGVTWTAPTGPTPPSQQGGGSPSGPPPTTCQQTGHPVNCATGEFWHSFLDLSVKGRGLGLWLVRTYSASLAATNGPFGFGWTHSYNMALTVGGTGSADLREESGSVITFTPNGAGGYQAPTWITATLTKNPDSTYTLRRKNQYSFVFNPAGQLIKEQDRDGNATSLNYSGSQLSAVTDASARQLQFVYSGSRIAKVSDPVGRSVTYQYDGSGNLVSATDEGGGITRFTYDANHLMLTMTNPNGGVLTNSYDAAGRIVSQADPMSRTTSWAYGANTTTITNPTGNMTREVFQNGRMVSLTKGFGTPQAVTWGITYDASTFTIIAVSDPNSHLWKYSRDGLGNVLAVTDPLGRATTFTYDSLNDPLTITDPVGAITRFGYDSSGNLTAITRSLNPTTQSVTTLTYDPAHAGDVVGVTDANGGNFKFTYDQYGNITRGTDAAGNAATFSYDLVSRVIASFGANGNVPGANPATYKTSYTYTAFNDLQSVTNPLGNKTTYQYDANRNLTSLTDAKGHTTRYTYDLDDESLTGTRADGSQVQNFYDVAGHVSRQMDALGNSTSYAYNTLQRLVSITDPLGRSTSVSYDAGGNRVAVTDAMGRIASYAYDAANEVTGITYSDGKTPNVSFQYDADGRRTVMTDGSGTSSYSYDALGRLVQSVNGAGAAVGYGYDLRGNLTSLTYPGGSRVARTFDANSRLATIADWAGNRTSFGYDAAGNLTAEIYPNGTNANLAYDAANRLVRITYSGPMGQISFAEGRDPIGQLSSETVGGAPPSGPVSYAYDTVNRLTSANFGVIQQAFQYDAADRLTRLTMTSAEGGTAVSALAYDPADELLTLTKTKGSQVIQKLQYSYDADGNRTAQTDQTGAVTAYSYDQANRLVDFAGKAQYRYNGDGLRMGKTVGGVPEPFTWNLVGPLPIVLQDGATRYVTGPGGLPLEQIAADGTVRFYLQDSLGSTRALTNASGKIDSVYVYDPYGNTLFFAGSKKANPFQFAGQYTDAESGFQYLRARYYDSTVGQFLTKDPLSGITGHPYVYANANPVNLTDPTGLLSGGDIWNFLSTWAEPLGALASAGAIIFGAIFPLAVFFEATSALLSLVTAINDAAKGNWLGAAVAIAAGIAGSVALFLKFVVVAKEAAAAAAEGQTLVVAIRTAQMQIIAAFDLGGLARMAFQLARAKEIRASIISNALDAVGMLLTILSEPPPIISAGDTGGGGPGTSPAPNC